MFSLQGAQLPYVAPLPLTDSKLGGVLGASFTHTASWYARKGEPLNSSPLGERILQTARKRKLKRLKDYPHPF